MSNEELKKQIIEAGRKAVKELIKVAKEDIIKGVIETLPFKKTK